MNLQGESVRNFFTFLLLAALLMPLPAEAWSLSQTGNKTSAFLLGFASGYLAHEAGHVIVASTKGYNVSLDGPTIIYPNANMSKADSLQVSSAGFQAQWLVSEAGFLYRGKNELTPTSDNFTAGVVCSHLVITTAYLTVLRNHHQGDLHGVSEATGLSTGQLAAMVAIPAILDSWRLFGDDIPKWVPALSIGAKGAGLVAIWTY
jgi:hypothetical protein